MKTNKEKEGIKEHKYSCFSKTFAYYEEHFMRTEGKTTIIPLRVFVNMETGEIKTIAEKYVREKGEEYYLDLFDK